MLEAAVIVTSSAMEPATACDELAACGGCTATLVVAASGDLTWSSAGGRATGVVVVVVGPTCCSSSEWLESEIGAITVAAFRSNEASLFMPCLVSLLKDITKFIYIFDFSKKKIDSNDKSFQLFVYF
jgi:hypothetical protein